MDRPDLDVDSHRLALRGLARINWWSGSVRILWPELAALAKRLSPSPLRVLDIASGGGDVPIGLWRKARRAGFSFVVEGCDISGQAVEYARARAKQMEADVAFRCRDALADEIAPAYDAVISSLFLHHLEEDQASQLLRRMAGAARTLVLVNDLARGAFGFLLAFLGTRVLSRSHVVHVDGPRSVESAFTPEEARELAERAGLHGATVVRRWPARLLLSWRRV